MTRLGLIGHRLSHSFSGRYFADKFARESLTDQYEYMLFELAEISQVVQLVHEQRNLAGFNVTIPYKESVLPFLDETDPVALQIGAVNTVVVIRSQTSDKRINLKGYNTDAPGFEAALKPLLHPHSNKALVLGTGGASKAVSFVLDQLQIGYLKVSRHPAGAQTIGYGAINESIMDQYGIIINTTPIGTYPDIKAAPPLPYHLVTSGHILFDLVYNPAETEFLRLGKLHGATVKNGYDMLVRQAELSWKTWTAQAAL